MVNAEIPQNECTLQTCSLDRGKVNYLPSVVGNGTYLIIFLLLILGQLVLGIKKRTWGFLAGMVIGSLIEAVGYGGRLWMHYSIFTKGPFLAYLVPLTIGPAFITAAIYIVLGRIIQLYGAQFSLIKPGLYSIIFMLSDFVSLLLQAAGGALTAKGEDGTSLQQTGINIMIAGLGFQVASLSLFMVLAGYFAIMVYRGFNTRLSQFASVTGSLRFRLFEIFLAIATVLVFIRCCFRVAELQEGFKGAIANSEPMFMVFEGPMIFGAVGLLTLLHPGVAFAGRWTEANFSIFKGSNTKADPYHWTELNSKAASEVHLNNAYNA